MFHLRSICISLEIYLFHSGSIYVSLEIYPNALVQIEQVFAVESVEEAVSNLSRSGEPWAQIALRNIGKALSFS